MDFIAIDFETANQHFNSACSLGMVFVKDQKIIDEKYFLIKPPSLYFHPKNIEIHGLTANDVRNEKTFADIWNEISPFLNGQLIVAHNAYFDLSVLKACLETYEISLPEIEYVCSIPISNRAINGLKVGQSLKARSAFFQIPLDQHHHALADARACAEIVIKSIQARNQNSLQSFIQTNKSLPVKKISELRSQPAFSSRKSTQRSFTPSIKVSDLTPETDKIDETNPLYGKNFVFTGELQSIERKDAMQKIINLGAFVKSAVSKKTDYLVIGIQDQKIVGPNGMSSKETKAIDLIHTGVNIELLTEDLFIQLLKKQ